MWEQFKNGQFVSELRYGIKYGEAPSFCNVVENLVDDFFWFLNVNYEWISWRIIQGGLTAIYYNAIS